MSKLIDLTGKRFEKLKVIKLLKTPKSGNSIWLCECDCGSLTKVYSNNLRRGISKSCGKHRFEDLVGYKFNNITVIKRIYNKSKHTQWLCVCSCGKKIIIGRNRIKNKTIKDCGKCRKYKDLSNKKCGKLVVENQVPVIKKKHTYWWCRCECGNRKLIEGSHISSNRAKSCGCLIYKNLENTECWKGYKEISKTYFSSLVNGAIRRGFEFNVTIEHVWNLFLKQDRKCALSGIELSFAKSLNLRGQRDQTASLDRIDSSKGYIKGNVQWIHKELQPLKWTKGDIDFIKWCHIVSDYQRNKINDNTSRNRKK